MADGTWFDNLTRSLAGSGDRRSFLRLLAGGVAGTALSAILPRDGEAAPVAQTCSPRPRVVVNSVPSLDQLTVTVSATGAGNALRRIAFDGLRNAVIDVPGVATGAGNGFSFTPPNGATQATFAVRAVDGSAAVHAPFVVTDDCGNWSSLVGAGAGTLRRQEVICPSFETVLTAPAPAGSTALQVSNQGCFKVGDQFTLNPGGPNEETLVVAGFSSGVARSPTSKNSPTPPTVGISATGGVVPSSPTTKSHSAGERAVRRGEVGAPCDVRSLISSDCAADLICCESAGESPLVGRCCPIGFCCVNKCCTTGLCCEDADEPRSGVCTSVSRAEDCCRVAGRGCSSGFRCCDLGDGQGRKCHPVSAFSNNAKHCSRCGNDCATAMFAGDRCVDGNCRCGSGPSCDEDVRCIRHINPGVGIMCCDEPNVACMSGTSTRCCPDSTHYCAQRGSPQEACCLKTRMACGGGCCSSSNAVCHAGTTCITCPCGGDTVNYQTNTCGCGSPTGPQCNLAQGQWCVGGACVCAASQGYKLGRVTCNLDASIPAYVPKRYECPIAFQRICLRVDPNLNPSINPEVDCRDSACSAGYMELPELCRTP